MNLTDQQKDLLRLLVAKHQSNGGIAFIFANSALAYPGDSVLIPNDELDFRQLRANGLISLIPLKRNQLRGQPTERGIAVVSRGFSPRRAMREYESRCCLIGSPAQDRLNERGDQREIQLNCQIELAGTYLRARRAAIARIRLDRDRDIAEAALLQEISDRRRQIGEAAASVVSEGVREFSDALVFSQQRLVVHAALLRDYTARFATEIRERLDKSELFRIQPLLPWSRDPIVHRAITTCEEIIDGRKKLEVPESGQGLADQEQDGPKGWAPVVLEWEALKSIGKPVPGPRERIPEADLRRILADQHGGRPEDVTEAQIELAAVDLCAHYGPFLIIPSIPNEGQSPSTAVEPHRGAPIPDPVFWKDREDEFRRHDTREKSELCARWHSPGDVWYLLAGGGASAASSESIQLFKSLAREAAKGLGSKRGAEAWIDWLNLLRCARDDDSGKLLYAKISYGTEVVGEIEYDRMVQDGSSDCGRALIEFIQTSDGGIERRRYWDTISARIDNLFRNSATLCLELRSLAPPSRPVASNTAVDGAVSGRRVPGMEAEVRRTLEANLGRWEHTQPPKQAGDSGAPEEPAASADALYYSRTAAKLNAVYSRYAGENQFKAGRQEELLHDAREYAAMSLTAALEKSELPRNASQTDIETACEKIRDRIVLETLTNYVPWHKYASDFSLGAREFKSALWTEGLPSLDDRARAAIEGLAGSIGAEEDSAPTSGNAGAEAGNPNATKEEAPEEPISATAPKRRGPRRDYETALQVAKVVGEVADDGNWRARLDEICDAMDEAEVRRPKPWKDKGYLTWSDCCVGERALVIKAIEHHMELAQEHKKTFS